MNPQRQWLTMFRREAAASMVAQRVPPSPDGSKSPTCAERTSGQLASQPLAIDIAGFANVHPDTPPLAFQPVWYRAWEAKLHEQACRASGHRSWMLSRFGGSAARELSTADCQPAFHAVAAASSHALHQFRSQAGRRVEHKRQALIFFDYWGRTSHLEPTSSRRDVFNLDIIPEFLLQRHGIGGFSCKLRAQRSAVPEAIQLATDLLCGSEIDLVLIGGLYRCPPMLAFSAVTEEIAAERSWLGKRAMQRSPLIECAGFCVVTRHTPADGFAAADSMNVSQLRFVQLPARRKPAIAALRAAWSAKLSGERALIYGGMRPSQLLAGIERQAAEGIAHASYENICQQFGDSGGLNPLLALERFAQLRLDRSASTTRTVGLISVTDASGGTWILHCQ